MLELFALLSRVAGSPEKAWDLLEKTSADLGVRPEPGSQVLAALALVKSGKSPEEVSSSLSWKEFESFCSKLLTAYGYSVEENVTLKKPRAQIDMVASGTSLVLSIDCKHWKKEHSPSVIRNFATSQIRRSELLRIRSPDAKPIVSAILSFSATQGTFVGGAAVVPIRTLRDFLSSVESYPGLLALR